MEFTGKVLKFHEWIIRFIEVDLPIGDLARDVIRDENFPKSNDYKILLEYFEDCSADDGLIKTFKSAWTYYSVGHST